MEKTKKEVSLYILPANTEVWSIDLQENIKFINNIDVILAHTTTLGDYVFVKKAFKFENLALSFATGTNCSSYTPTKNEFGVSEKNLIFVKKITVYE
jgi:hypothetical protein